MRAPFELIKRAIDPVALHFYGRCFTAQIIGENSVFLLSAMICSTGWQDHDITRKNHSQLTIEVTIPVCIPGTKKSDQ